MVNTQIRGNCQCCGRQQAVQAQSGRFIGGVMSKHGYTVEQGWFNGVCSGRNHPPLQISRTVTDKIIADINAEVPELIAKANKVKAGEITPKFVKTFKKQEIPFEQGNPREQHAARTSLEWAYRNRARTGEHFAESMAKVADKYHGQPLVEVSK